MVDHPARQQRAEANILPEAQHCGGSAEAYATAREQAVRTSGEPLEALHQTSSSLVGAEEGPSLARLRRWIKPTQLLLAIRAHLFQRVLQLLSKQRSAAYVLGAVAVLQNTEFALEHVHLREPQAALIERQHGLPLEDGLAAHGQLRAVLQLCTQHVPAAGGGARARAQAGAAARAAGPGLAAQPARCTPGTCLDEEFAGLPCAKCHLRCLKHLGQLLCRDAVEPSLPCVVNFGTSNR